MTVTHSTKTNVSWLSRWMPITLLESVQDEVGRIFWPYGYGRPPLRERLLHGTRTPQTEVYERNGDLLVRVELPGIKREEISITLQQGSLLIQGETRPTSEELDPDYSWRDPRYRSYYRRVRLPFEAQPELITATYNDGVLGVQVTNPAEYPPEKRSIAVQ